MKTLYVDLDGTLNDYPRILRERGRGHQINDEFHLAFTGEARPLPGAKEAINAFRADGWRIVILSSRSFKDAEILSRQWLAINGFGNLPVMCTNGMAGKPVALNILRPTLFVDDFTGRQESLPVFLTEVYEACVKTGVPVEVFRNNWEEIIERWLGWKINLNTRPTGTNESITPANSAGA